MNVLNIVTTLLILIGSVTILSAVLSTNKILQLIKNKKNYKAWKVLKFLMIFFLIGYLAAAGLVLFETENTVVILSGIVFFFGAIFVFIVVRIGFITINDFNQAEIEIKKLNVNSNKK